MADKKILNGLNVTAVEELIKNVTDDPELAKCRFHIKNNWITCGQNQSKVKSFFAAKQEIVELLP